MHKYFIKIPWLLRTIYPGYLWRIHTSERKVYLTFDDGPHPVVTPWVLDLLKANNIRGSFFCIGKNVEAHPGLYQRILDEGHVVGNHSFNHLNGWKTSDDEYVQDVVSAARLIPSHLFRPPYGRIRRSQARKIRHALNAHELRIVMWEVLSADFDEALTPEDCYNNVVNNVSAGSVVVFHDSEKAFVRLKDALPRAIEYLKEKGFAFERLD